MTPEPTELTTPDTETPASAAPAKKAPAKKPAPKTEPVDTDGPDTDTPETETETEDLWATSPQDVCPGSVHALVEPIQELVGVPVTGHYDKQTVAAVKALQASLDVPQSGVFSADLRSRFLAAVGADEG